ncbi:MAG: carbohydrate-binding protein, partial [Pontiellaceae bacterium]|nr:carbohydrate-binding protein [Pontiellaceae bacterium]
GVVYLYTSHDEDNAGPGMGRFLMKDWQCYTSTDMVNWTDHGTIASLKTFPWAVQENDAWAPQAIERDGKFYFYAPVSVPGWPKNVIAVAVADGPLGPYEDALGKPLVGPENGFIDPSPFIDDDGQAYLYWGNPNLWYVKLNDNMISYSGEVIKDPSFAKVEGEPDPFHFQEGPWAYKRAGRYYMAYASTCCPEGMGYAMSDSPEGPWEFGGYIMRPDSRSSGNHPGIIDYKGKSYVFGFNFKLNFSITETHHERRSVCVAELKFNPDGTIQELPWWEEADPVDQVEALNPYTRVEGETIAWSEGMASEPCSEGGMNVYPKRDGAFIKVQGVDFGAPGAGAFTASVACGTEAGLVKGATIELHLDGVDGPLVGTVPVGYTGGAWKEETISVELSESAGVRDLYFVFRGESVHLLKFDWWRFAKKSAEPKLVAVNASVEQYKIDTASGDANRIPLRVDAIYSDGTMKEVSGLAQTTVDKPAVASVGEGMVSGVAAGETTLMVEFEGKSDALSLIVKDLKSELTPRKLIVNAPRLDLIVGNKQGFSVTVEYVDGHTEDITQQATYTVADPQKASVEDGVITVLDKGRTTVQVEFKGRYGMPVSAPIAIVGSYRNPFVRNKADEFDAQSGVLTENSSEEGSNICNIENGDWVSFNALDFGSGAKTVELRVASATEGGTIEIYLDRVDSKPVGTCKVSNTGGWQSWETVSCRLQHVRGQHDVYFRFTGGSGYLLNVYDWKFSK